MEDFTSESAPTALNIFFKLILSCRIQIFYEMYPRFEGIGNLM